MGAIHKMAPVGVCGALLYTGACWMYGWLRAAEKTHLGRAFFAPFLEYTQGDTYRRSLCSKNLKNQATEIVRARYFYFLRIDGSEQCRTQNNVQHCRASCTVTRTAVVGGKQRLCLCFVLPLFSLQKRFPHLAFWLFRVGLCCGSWLLSPSHGHLASRASADLANSLRFMCSVQRKLCCSWSSALHRSTIKTDEKEVFLEVEYTLGPLRS